MTIYVADGQDGAVIETLVHTARTGQRDDGKIAVYNIEDLVHIGIGESDEEAQRTNTGRRVPLTKLLTQA